MSLATEFKLLAELLIDAANQIAHGIDAGYSEDPSEQRQHPAVKGMRQTERQCRQKAIEFWKMAQAVEKKDQQ